MLKFTGASAATSVYIPPASKQYIVYNNSGYTITIYNSTVIGNTTAAGTGISVVNGDKIMVWSDATNVYDLQAQNLTGTLAISKGGTGQTTANAAFNALAPAQTANRLLKSDGTNTSFAQVALTTDVTGILPVANGGTGLTTLAALGSLFYPVGSIYSSTVSTNPGTSLGFGTWTAFGAGRVMMGSGNASYLAGTTGGSADAIVPSHTHTATVTDPGHQHQNTNGGKQTAGPFGSYSGGGSSAEEGGGVPNSFLGDMNAATTGITVANSTTGVSATNANLQPYIVVYIWERTA
jgi:hypothetical protein